MALSRIIYQTIDPVTDLMIGKKPVTYEALFDTMQNGKMGDIESENKALRILETIDILKENALNEKDEFNRTVLAWACFQKWDRFVLKLFALSNEKKFTLQYQNSALLEAITHCGKAHEKNCCTIVQKLLEEKADPNTLSSGNPDLRPTSKDVSAVNLGKTVLYLAAQNNLATVAQKLLASGANPNIKSTAADNTPLHVAAEKNYVEVARILLKWKANPNLPNVIQKTPLHVSATNGCMAIIQELLACGANKNLQDSLNYYTHYYNLFNFSNAKEAFESEEIEKKDKAIQDFKNQTHGYFSIQGAEIQEAAAISLGNKDIDIKNWTIAKLAEKISSASNFLSKKGFDIQKDEQDKAEHWKNKGLANADLATKDLSVLHLESIALKMQDLAIQKLDSIPWDIQELQEIDLGTKDLAIRALDSQDTKVKNWVIANLANKLSSSDKKIKELAEKALKSEKIEDKNLALKNFILKALVTAYNEIGGMFHFADERKKDIQVTQVHLCEFHTDEVHINTKKRSTVSTVSGLPVIEKPSLWKWVKQQVVVCAILTKKNGMQLIARLFNMIIGFFNFLARGNKKKMLTTQWEEKKEISTPFCKDSPQTRRLS